MVDAYETFVKRNELGSESDKETKNRIALMITIDYSRRRLTPDKWQTIFQGVCGLITRLRMQDVFSIDLCGQQLTGENKKSNEEILASFDR